jgi:hypothetical protein
MCQAVGQVPGTLIDWAAGVIGVPCAVVSKQITLESGGSLGAVSPTGAQGPAQFEPGTWQSQGCSGSPFNANDAMKCYAQFMYQLVKQFHGNVRDALAAYNAGPGNLPAGYGYADSILGAAGQSSGLQAGAGTGTGAAQPGTGTDSSSSPLAGSDCAFAIGGQHIGLIFGHGPSLPSACLITKTEVRAMFGGLLLAAGALIMVPGLVIVMAYGFRASGAASAVTKAAGAVPGYGRVVRQATRTTSRPRVSQRQSKPPAGRGQAQGRGTGQGQTTGIRGRATGANRPPAQPPAGP